VKYLTSDRKLHLKAWWLCDCVFTDGGKKSPSEVKNWVEFHLFYTTIYVQDFFYFVLHNVVYILPETKFKEIIKSVYYTDYTIIQIGAIIR